jgi:hypothetical protein
VVNPRIQHSVRTPIGAPGVSSRRQPARSGVALLDAIIAAVILGVALAAIIGLGSQALSTQATGEQLRIASMLADEQLNLVLARGPDNYAQRYTAAGACDAPYTDYSYELDFADGVGGNPYRVRATIRWGTGSAARSVVIETLVAPRTGDDPDPDRRPTQPVERVP